MLFLVRALLGDDGSLMVTLQWVGGAGWLAGWLRRLQPEMMKAGAG